ncbi:MAG TPA: type II toxin-antitoxin system VapC family toxin [Rhizomicrobium sp.]|nr:type II toxin-antitoxin system VapC family toxin [Rhizomicrobium sp.]
MILYAESSAVLAWLLRQAAGQQVEGILASASDVLTSDLTLIECQRAFHREAALGRMSEESARQVEARFAGARLTWRVLRLLAPVVERAKQRFPYEPIRSLDALHVASALHAKNAAPDLAMLSLDHRVRRVAESVGLALLPA